MQAEGGEHQRYLWNWYTNHKLNEQRIGNNEHSQHLSRTIVRWCTRMGLEMTAGGGQVTTSQ